MQISVFDMFSIGIGPSSSHTLGPWRAGLDFVCRLRQSGRLPRVQAVRVELYGSLAKTGKGHGTDMAIQMGLSGIDYETVDPLTIPARLDLIRSEKTLRLGGERTVAFDRTTDLAFRRDVTHPEHANALAFMATLDDGEIYERLYFSIGGGFIVRAGEEQDPNLAEVQNFCYPSDTAAELARICEANHLSIAELVRRNEECLRSREAVDAGLDRIWQVMGESIYNGCHAEEGILPGGLNVHRRAADYSRRLLPKQHALPQADWETAIRTGKCDMGTVTDWITAFALAVNEVNASYGRIVTAPTNGAAGVIPAVLSYCIHFEKGAEPDCHRIFLLTAGEIGSIFKKGATISAAMGGCQAEIGVSSAMAAAGMAAVLGGTPGQCMMAAEIAMEHHLGLTCDPIGGLVQIPCIERNGFGAIKAITAARMALAGSPADARVSLDDVVATMYETAKDMSTKYKETAECGLAIRIPISLPEC